MAMRRERYEVVVADIQFAWVRLEIVDNGGVVTLRTDDFARCDCAPTVGDRLVITLAVETAGEWPDGLERIIGSELVGVEVPTSRDWVAHPDMDACRDASSVVIQSSQTTERA